MDTAALQFDPDLALRGLSPAIRAAVAAGTKINGVVPSETPNPNLAITLGTQAPQLNALRQPQVAGPGPISMPQAKPPDLSVSQPKVALAPRDERTNELGVALNGPIQQSNEPEAPPRRGTVVGDQAYRSHLLDTGSGISQIAPTIENSGFGKAHPTLGKILGVGAQGLATVGDLGLSVLGGGFGRLAAQAIPGTQEHHMALVNQANHQVGAEEGEREKEAETQAWQAEVPLRQAQTAHEQAEADAVGQPKPKDESWKVIPEYTGPNGEPIEVEQNSGQIKVGGSDVSGIKPSKASKEVTPQRETYDSLIKQGMTPIQAYEKIREKPGGTTINEGTWSLQEDASGKPILLNSKTGEAKDAPAGIAKSGTHAKAEAAQKKEMEPVEGAVGYASDYLKNGAFTGPGDEALQEKFFELAKPSTGFRMTQQQMAMLQNSRSWMGGLEGHLRHATTGTWFSDEQRKQIVDTMNQLAEEKRKAAGDSLAAPQAGPPAGAQIVKWEDIK